MAITTNEALDKYPALKTWAKKAREELGKNWFIFEGGGKVNIMPDNPSFPLCKEYDDLMKDTEVNPLGYIVRRQDGVEYGPFETLEEAQIWYGSGTGKEIITMWED